MPLMVHRAQAAADVPAEEWEQAKAVIAYHRLAYDEALCQRLTNCRILVRVGVGCDNVDLAAFAARGIPVCNVPDYGVGEVADHTIALLLALTRGVISFHNAIAHDPVHGWNWRQWPPMVHRLQGKRLLIVGYGAIGRAVARRAAAFDLMVNWYDPYAPTIDGDSGGQRLHDLNEALGQADIVSLHATLAQKGLQILDRRRIAAMKPGAVLINTARGGLVDLDALTDSLQQGHIGAVGLDVLAEEPPDPRQRLFVALSENAAWTKGRIVVTPHAAFLSADAINDMRRKAIETAVAYLRDGTLRHCVNAAQLDLSSRPRQSE